MSGVVALFNPRDEPFGELSNNAKSDLYITTYGEFTRWPTATNFIYGALLKNPNYRTMLQNSPVKKVQRDYKILAQRTIEDTTSKALDIALPHRFNSQAMIDLLMSTGDAPIVYVSPNAYLGIGEDGNGRNIYGRKLQEMRYRIKIGKLREQETKDISEMNQKVVLAFKALAIMKNAIKTGVDPAIFEGKAADEIVDNDKDIFVDERTLIHQFNNNQLDPNILLAVQGDTEALLRSAKREELGRLRENQLHRQKKIAFDVFAKSVLESDYSNIDPSDFPVAIAQAESSMPSIELRNVQNTIYNLFKEGLLDQGISDNIQTQIGGLYVPSEEEVRDVMREAAAESPIKERSREEVINAEMLELHRKLEELDNIEDRLEESLKYKSQKSIEQDFKAVGRTPREIPKD